MINESKESTLEDLLRRSPKRDLPKIDPQKFGIGSPNPDLLIESLSDPDCIKI